jgi:hypothetical protein
LNNSNTENPTPPTNSIDPAHRIDFTFRASSIAALDSEVDISKPISEANTYGECQNMKHLKGHPDAPTPANSPQKKQVCKGLDDVVDMPSPQLLFPSAATKSSSESLSNENDVFGIVTHKTTKQASLEIGTLFCFWSQESIEEKTDFDHQDFEELRTTREWCELEEDQMTAMKKDW